MDTPKVGFIQSIKNGINTRMNNLKEDTRLRIEEPDKWREKDNSRRLIENQNKLKQLEYEAKIARQEASIARTKAVSQKYQPAPDFFGGGDIFDNGGFGGSGNFFDMSAGGGGLFDTEPNRRTHKKNHKKKTRKH